MSFKGLLILGLSQKPRLKDILIASIFFKLLVATIENIEIGLLVLRVGPLKELLTIRRSIGQGSVCVVHYLWMVLSMFKLGVKGGSGHVMPDYG